MLTSLCRGVIILWLSITEAEECCSYAAAATEGPADGDNSQRRKRSKTDDVYQLLGVLLLPPLQCAEGSLVLINEPAQCRGLALTPISL